MNYTITKRTNIFANVRLFFCFNCCTAINTFFVCIVNLTIYIFIRHLRVYMIVRINDAIKCFISNISTTTRNVIHRRCFTISFLCHIFIRLNMLIICMDMRSVVFRMIDKYFTATFISFKSNNTCNIIIITELHVRSRTYKF